MIVNVYSGLNVVALGATPVYFAAQEGRLQALRYLHDIADCDLTKASEDGLKPIHAACQAGHTSIVKVG